MTFSTPFTKNLSRLTSFLARFLRLQINQKPALTLRHQLGVYWMTHSLCYLIVFGWHLLAYFSVIYRIVYCYPSWMGICQLSYVQIISTLSCLFFFFLYSYFCYTLVMTCSLYADFGLSSGFCQIRRFFGYWIIDCLYPILYSCFGISSVYSYLSLDTSLILVFFGLLTLTLYISVQIIRIKPLL